jgi:Holliday junction resolvase-like predicted endonuclease
VSTQQPRSIRFTLNGQRYELTRAVVESRLRDVVPEIVHKHAVRVNGMWFPVRQAFEKATGIPRSEFISHAACRHLAALGFEVHGDIESRNPQATVSHGDVAAWMRDSRAADATEDWHTESNVQAAVVTAFAADGWRVLSVANTAAKERGIDIIASRHSQSVGVEVKGFPSRSYADPARAGEVKPTQPSTQARHWYAAAVLAAMRLRGKEPTWRSAIALPDFPRYRDLHAETRGSLSAAGIEVWWVQADGTVAWS